MTDKLQPPDATKIDKALAVVKGVIGELPGGSTAIELLGLITASPLERRRQAWAESVAEEIRKLQARTGLSVEDLAANDSFVDMLLQASREAMLTSQQEKLDALRNAVVNSASPDAPEASLQQMFLAWVERFTPWHLRILRLFQNPRGFFAAKGQQPPGFNMGSLVQTLTTAYPELHDKRVLFDQWWQDLSQQGLVGTSGLHSMMSAHGASEKQTTALGDQFLAFISGPKS